MADDKTFTLDEHLAVLNDRVEKETASLTAERDQLLKDKTELASKLDVETAAKTAAEQRATDAEKSLEDFKTEVTEREEAAARKDERLSKLREAAKHMDEAFFTDEGRVARVVAMDEEAFTGYLADLGATGAKAPTKTTDVPRETAMKGDDGAAAKQAESVGRNFLMREYAHAATKEG